jgi:hypothetical protein
MRKTMQLPTPEKDAKKQGQSAAYLATDLGAEDAEEGTTASAAEAAPMTQRRLRDTICDFPTAVSGTVRETRDRGRRRKAQKSQRMCLPDALVRQNGRFPKVIFAFEDTKLRSGIKHS